MRRPRILHLGKYYRPFRGGIETVLETLCQGERSRADSRALVMSKARRTTHEMVGGVNVTRVGSLATIGAVSVTPTLPFWLASADADVIVLHEPNPMGLVAYWLARPRSPLVVWFHSEVIRPRWRYRLFYEPFLEFALKRAARIVVASPPMLDVPALAAYRAKCEVIPYGLNVERYDPPPAEEDADSPRRMGAATRLLFVGRLVGYKGVDVLLKALPGLAAEAVIIGDGPQRASLVGLAQQLGIEDRIRFIGEASDEDLLAWYRACDVFVLPSVSRQEAFGMVQLEAMLCGRPVVSTDLETGVSWVNQHERTGLVVRRGDAASLHEALARLIADPQLRRTLGREARSRILAQFTSERMCDATLSLYRELYSARYPAGSTSPAPAS